MATLGNTVKTLADWAKERDPNGKSSVIAEILSQQNEILEDAHYVEGNLPTGHQESIRTGLPTVYWRMLNQGTPNSKATSAQVVENCGRLVARCQTDKDLAELAGDLNGYRMNEAKAFMEAMNQEMAATMFYGAASAPEEFVGLANRYTSTSDANGQNIISAGGSGADNSSIWLVGWGDQSIFNIFPKGSSAGLDHEDRGIQEAEDGSSNRYMAYVDYFTWKTGLCVKDWRYGVRIPNIDISDLVSLSTTQATTASTFLPKLMSRAIDRLPSMTGIKPVFYANRTVKSHLRVMAMEKASSVLSIEDGLNQFGQRISELRFLGIPIRTCDALTEAESVVS